MFTLIVIALLVGFVVWNNKRSDLKAGWSTNTPMKPQQQHTRSLTRLPKGNYADPKCLMCHGNGKHQDIGGGHFFVTCNCVAAGRDAARARLHAQERETIAQENEQAEQFRRHLLFAPFDDDTPADAARRRLRMELEMSLPPSERNKPLTPDQEAKIEAGVVEAMQRYTPPTVVTPVNDRWSHETDYPRRPDPPPAKSNVKWVVLLVIVALLFLPLGF